MSRELPRACAVRVSAPWPSDTAKAGLQQGCPGPGSGPAAQRALRPMADAGPGCGPNGAIRPATVRHRDCPAQTCAPKHQPGLRALSGRPGSSFPATRRGGKGSLQDILPDRRESRAGMTLPARALVSESPEPPASTPSCNPAITCAAPEQNQVPARRAVARPGRSVAISNCGKSGDPDTLLTSGDAAWRKRLCRGCSSQRSPGRRHVVHPAGC